MGSYLIPFSSLVFCTGWCKVPSMYVLLDEKEAPYPVREYSDVLDALPASRELMQRVIVARRGDDGTYEHLAYSGPGGWFGPSGRPRHRLAQRDPNSVKP